MYCLQYLVLSVISMFLLCHFQFIHIYVWVGVCVCVCISIFRISMGQSEYLNLLSHIWWYSFDTKKLLFFSQKKKNKIIIELNNNIRESFKNSYPLVAGPISDFLSWSLFCGSLAMYSWSCIRDSTGTTSELIYVRPVSVRRNRTKWKESGLYFCV